MNKLLKNTLKKTAPIKWFLGKINNLEKAQKAERAQIENCVKQIQSLRRQNNELRQEMNYLYYKGLHPDQYPAALKEWYKEKTGTTLDLDHPKTYNEKIQWLKLYDSTPLKTKLADKYLVRDWVSEKIGSQYLIPLLGVYDKFDDINFDELPDKFVIKTNHASGTNRIVTDKSKFNVKEAREFFNKKMRMNFAFWYGLELHYKDIVPKIIVEKYIDNGGNNLYDYKFLCFDGEVRFILFFTDRKVNLKMASFDRQWNRLPFTQTAPQYEKNLEKPSNLDEMIFLAERLSEGFHYVRVDFYRLNDGTIKFGEMTFTPTSGVDKIEPEEYDKLIGDCINLPISQR